MKLPPIVLVALLVLSGCSSYTTPAPGTRALVLDKEQAVHYYGSTFTVTLPAGRYSPAFQTEKGTFYRSPSTLIIHAMGSGPVNGGIFLPASGIQDQRQGFWFENNGQTPHIGVRDRIMYRLE